MKGKWHLSVASVSVPVFRFLPNLSYCPNFLADGWCGGLNKNGLHSLPLARCCKG